MLLILQRSEQDKQQSHNKNGLNDGYDFTIATVQFAVGSNLRLIPITIIAKSWQLSNAILGMKLH